MNGWVLDQRCPIFCQLLDHRKIIKKGGFVRCGWDGEQATEAKVKEQTAATIRCIPFDENPNGLNCVFTGKPAKHEVIFDKAY